VALEGEESVVADHAVTVVGDADELAASGFDLDADAGGSGVEGVLKQLLDDGCRAFDDFAGGDLVRHEVGENADAAHGSIVRGSLKRGERSALRFIGFIGSMGDESIDTAVIRLEVLWMLPWQSPA
jgi:hypothetical protein